LRGDAIVKNAPYGSERIAMSRLRLTTEAAVTRGCALLVSEKDDSLRDLRRKS